MLSLKSMAKFLTSCAMDSSDGEINLHIKLFRNNLYLALKCTDYLGVRA